VRKRWFPLLVLLLSPAVVPGAGGAAPVLVSPGLGLDRVGAAPGGGLGLLVPDAGPRTSEARARAGLERGAVRNSLHGEEPPGEPLITLRDAGLIGASGVGESLLVGIPRGGDQANDRRYLVVDGSRPPGLLTSRSTRIPGLVSAVDVAPTARGEEGALGWTAHPDPAGYLRDLDARIGDNGAARSPAGALALVVIALLAAVRPRAAVLAFSTVPLANLALGAAGISEPWATVPLIGLGAAAALPLARVLRTPLALGLAFAGTLAAYLVAMAAETTWVALSPLGPTQNARFYGLSNLLMTLLLVPALAGAALLWRRGGWLAFGGVGALALVTIAGSRFGADGGGAIVLAAGFAVLAVALAGGGARAWFAAAAAAAAAVAIVAADALLGPSTHVGRAARGGPGEVLGDVGDRIVLSWERVTGSPSVALVVVAALVVAAVVGVRAWHRPLVLAFLVALGVSLVVNDSPLDVAVAGAAALACLARWPLEPASPGDAVAVESRRSDGQPGRRYNSA
jgi:hypothetical protein